MNHSLEDYMEHRSKLLVDVIFPIGIYVGILVNIVAIFIWVFGPKSRSLCCATYFAANAVADFLTLSITGIWLIICLTHFNANCYYSAATCKIYNYLQIVLFQTTNWISTTITVERALTIMYPLKFRSNDMRRHSKYAIPIMVILLLLVNIPAFYKWKKLEGTVYCEFNIDVLVYDISAVLFRSLLPFIAIVTFNCCTIATLCKQRRNPVSTNQERYLNVFTKITLLTGLLFVISNTVEVTYSTMHIFGLAHFFAALGWTDFILVVDLSLMMCYLNCLMNPIISVLVCKSMQEDIKTFLQRLLRVCRRQ